MPDLRDITPTDDSIVIRLLPKKEEGLIKLLNEPTIFSPEVRIAEILSVGPGRKTSRGREHMYLRAGDHIMILSNTPADYKQDDLWLITQRDHLCLVENLND